MALSLSAAMRFKDPRSVALTPEEEAIIVTFWLHALWPPDEDLDSLRFHLAVRFFGDLQRPATAG